MDGELGPILAFAAIAVALALYATPRLPLEFSSLFVVCLLLLAFHIFPETGPEGGNLLGRAPCSRGSPTRRCSLFSA